MMTAIEIGNRLRDLRGKTPAIEVAEAIGISRSALANYECGIRIPRDEIKEVIAHYYGMTVGALFFNE